MVLSTIREIETNNVDPNVSDFQKALRELYLFKDHGQNKITLYEDDALPYVLEIYHNTVVLRDLLPPFDGPGGPTEIFSARINVQHIFKNAEKIMHLISSADDKNLIKLLNSLPKSK